MMAGSAQRALHARPAGGVGGQDTVGEAERAPLLDPARVRCISLCHV